MASRLTQIRDQYGDEVADQWLEDQINRVVQAGSAHDEFLSEQQRQQALAHSQMLVRSQLGNDDGLGDDITTIRKQLEKQFRAERPDAKKEEIRRCIEAWENDWVQSMAQHNNHPLAVSPRRQIAITADELRFRNGQRPLYSDPNLYGNDIREPAVHEIDDGAPKPDIFDEAQQELMRDISGGGATGRRDRYASGVDTRDPWDD